jgi:Na+-driven multidrug efflux pump
VHERDHGKALRALRHQHLAQHAELFQVGTPSFVFCAILLAACLLLRCENTHLFIFFHFSDNSPEVRQAAVDAARIVMGQMSPQGVKLILPGVLKGLDDRTWRTKQARGIVFFQSICVLLPPSVCHFLACS